MKSNGLYVFQFVFKDFSNFSLIFHIFVCFFKLSLILMPWGRQRAGNVRGGAGRCGETCGERAGRCGEVRGTPENLLWGAIYPFLMKTTEIVANSCKSEVFD